MAEKILGSSVTEGGGREGEQPYPATFTPGPWESDGDAIFVSDDGLSEGRMLAEAWDGTSADMTLMAAAPELHAAVVSALALLTFDLRNMTVWGPDYNQAARDVLDRCVDAIAKASPAAAPIRQDAGGVTDETDTTARTPVITDEPEG